MLFTNIFFSLPKDRMMWDVKFISSLFSIVIVPLAFYCVNYDEALVNSPNNGTSFIVRASFIMQ